MRREPRRRSWSLRRRIAVGLIGYVLLLSAAITLHGYIVNERAEHLVWESLLHAEFEHLIERHRNDAGFDLIDNEALQLFAPGPAMPPQLAALPPGIHDEIVVDGRERVLLVREVDGQRYVLALEIGELEHRESQLSLAVFASALLLVLLLSAASIWGINRLLRPLRSLAADIAALDPRRGRERLAAATDASEELVVIADAMNDYLARNERFLERERAFLDTTSHELRTPVAVIAGAAQNALTDQQLAATTRGQIERIRQTAADIEKLVGLLLVLAKDPTRLAEISERIELHSVLPDIIANHRHLCADKMLELHCSAPARCIIDAPLDIVRVAIGNLLRNAIENSDHGSIIVTLDARGIVRIDDPGRGMTPEQVSAIYSRLARGGDREGGGIGLALIGRLSEHLRWPLTIDSDPGKGSHVTLDLSSALAKP